MITIQFLKAGSSIFTVDNGRGQHFTYRVKQNNSKKIFFVQLLTGPNNLYDYTYLGLYDEQDNALRLTLNSAQPTKSIPVQVFNWALRVICGKAVLPDGYSIMHSGRCGRCCRLLTTPESIARGIGPECLSKMA